MSRNIHTVRDVKQIVKTDSVPVATYAVGDALTDLLTYNDAALRRHGYGRILAAHLFHDDVGGAWEIDLHLFTQAPTSTPTQDSPFSLALADNDSYLGSLSIGATGDPGGGNAEHAVTRPSGGIYFRTTETNKAIYAVPEVTKSGGIVIAGSAASANIRLDIERF